MDYNIHKICRVCCIEDGALTSIYSSDFAISPYFMMMQIAKIRIHRADGLPSGICNNCIYRLGVSYHFKQECENSDHRLRQYLGLERGYGVADAVTNTDPITISARKSGVFTELNQNVINDGDDDDDDDEGKGFLEKPTSTFGKKRKKTSRYQRKPPEQQKKRGPKPLHKIPQTCSFCNKTFKCAAQLHIHIRTHTQEKPFACTHFGCDRRFAQKYNLHIHMRQHTGEKPYQCEICSKQFAALGNFQAHQKIHTGERQFQCPICQKSFYSSGDVTKHMVTHSGGIKNHHCDICLKAFTRQRDMRAHKRKFHSELLAVDDEIDDDDAAGDQTINVVTGGVGTVGTDTDSNSLTAMGALSNNLKCSDCDKEFNTSSSLGMHFRPHTNNLLNLPLTTHQLQLPPVPMHPPPHPPPHHYAHAPPPHHPTHATHDIHSQIAMQSNASMAGMMHPSQRLHHY